MNIDGWTSGHLSTGSPGFQDMRTGVVQIPQANNINVYKD